MKKYAQETTVGMFVLIGLAAIAYMTVKLGDVSVGEKTYPLYAPFTTVSGLKTGSAVDMFGIEVGRVEQITLDQKNQRAVVKLKIRQGVTVYDDAILSIKTEGLIGDKYLSLDPGGAGQALAPGGTITETQPAVDIGDIIGKYAFGQVKTEEKTKEEPK